ncbi:MAG: DUF4350 domain-containing protein [Gammaproteobacteria bacterium]|nr:DUF4350 domain-containing protein [Gammaproteobacteria bacterium]
MKRVLLTVALLLAGAALYSWFISTHEKGVENVYVGYKGEARLNNFLAAELLLNEVGIEVESQQHIRASEWLPPETDTLVMLLAAEIAVPEESELLLQWVNDGGHLLLLPTRDETRDVVTFLERLNLRLAREISIVSDASEEAGASELPEDYDYRLARSAWHRIELLSSAVAPVTLTDESGIVAVRQKQGDGHVTVFASGNWFLNNTLAEQDHARLFLDAVAGFIVPGKVWIVYDAAFAPLWRLIWDSARYLVVGLLLAFVLWLWSRMPRMGPLLPVPEGARRSIIEHVSAAGRFVWDNNSPASLVAASVAAVIHKAERRHPGIGRLPAEKQAVAIGHLVDEDAQDILEALMNTADDRPREFARHMKFLQKIRNKL